MKIFVDRMPRDPEECLFARKEIYDEFTQNGKKISLHQYYCAMNKKLCKLYLNENCSKLRVLR